LQLQSLELVRQNFNLPPTAGQSSLRMKSVLRKQIGFFCVQALISSCEIWSTGKTEFYQQCSVSEGNATQDGFRISGRPESSRENHCSVC